MIRFHISRRDTRIVKEEKILFPMLMDALSDADWFEIQKQTPDIGYCLYDPPAEWVPEGRQATAPDALQQVGDRIQLPSGSFS